MKKILFLTNLTEFGGGETYLAAFAERLAAGGAFAPVVCAFSEGPLLESLRAKGIRTEILPDISATRIAKLIPRFNPANFVKVIRWLKKEQISLIQLEQFNNRTFLIALLGSLAGVPAIYRCHQWSPYVKPYVRWYLKKFFRLILPVSQKVRADLESSGVAAGAEVEVIPCAVDVEKFGRRDAGAGRRESLNIPEGVFAVGMVARFQRVKGHHVFVEAMAELERRGVDFRAFMVGDALFERPEYTRYKEQIQRAVREGGLGGRITLTGFVSDVGKILCALDAVVVPSLSETFGVAVIEAMAAGLPVVATRCGGPEEIIEDGVSGFLVPVESPAETADRVELLARDRELRGRVGAAAKKRSRFFSIEKNAEDLMKIYERLTAG